MSRGWSFAPQGVCDGHPPGIWLDVDLSHWSTSGRLRCRRGRHRQASRWRRCTLGRIARSVYTLRQPERIPPVLPDVFREVCRAHGDAASPRGRQMRMSQSRVMPTSTVSGCVVTCPLQRVGVEALMAGVCPLNAPSSGRSAVTSGVHRASYRFDLRRTQRHHTAKSTHQNPAASQYDAPR